jgi:hypothetical protein
MVVLTFDWRRNGPYTHQASTEEGHCCHAGSQIALPHFGTGGIAIDTGGMQFPPTRRRIQLPPTGRKEESNIPGTGRKKNPSTWNTKALTCLPTRLAIF